MYRAIKTSSLKDVLRDNGIAYNDIFRLEYRAGIFPEYVGYLEKESRKENQRTYFSYIKTRRYEGLVFGREVDMNHVTLKAKILDLDKMSSIIEDDKYFLQRVETLIMTKKVRICRCFEYNKPSESKQWLFRIIGRYGVPGTEII